MDTDNNFTVTNDNMIDAYRSALPMSTNKELLKRDGSKGVVVLNSIIKMYDAHESREERLAHLANPNDPIYKWAMQFPVGPDGKPSPIDQSRINWLAQTLSKDELSYTTAIELGLNDPSHIGVNTSLSRPQLESQARFKSLPMYDAEYTRNTNMQDDAGIQQSSNYTRLPDGSYYYDPTSNEPVLVKNEQGNYMDQAGNAAFKLGTNPDLNTRLSDRWLESNAGSTWELVDPRNGTTKKIILTPGRIYNGDPIYDTYTETLINKDTNTIQIRVHGRNPESGAALDTIQELYPKKLLEHKNYDLPKQINPGAVSGEGEDNDLVETMVSDLSVKEGFVDTKRIDPTQKIDEKTGKPVVQYNIGYGVMLGKESNEAFESIGKTKEEIDGINNGTIKITKADAQDLSRYILKKRYIPTVTKLVTPEIWNEMPEYLKKELISEEYRSMISQSKNTTKLIRERKFGEAAKEYLNSKEYARVEKGGVGKRYRLLSDALLKYQAELDLIAKNKKDGK